MDNEPQPVGAPSILIVNGDEWSIRSLETVLDPVGYDVLRAFNAKQAQRAAVDFQPDAILLDIGLPRSSGIELCDLLSQDRRIRSNTPLLVTTINTVTHATRIAALKAGAWEVIGLPADPEELVLRLGTLVRAKREADRARTESMVDPVTGLYNMHGLHRRAHEMGALARRCSHALGCVVFAPARAVVSDAPLDRAGNGGHRNGGHRPPRRPVEALARMLVGCARSSDVVAHLSPFEMAVLAYNADEQSTRRLAERVVPRLDATLDTDSAGPELGSGGGGVHAGFHAEPNFRNATIDPSELVARAALAVRAPRVHGESRIRPYGRVVDHQR